MSVKEGLLPNANGKPFYVPAGVPYAPSTPLEMLPLTDTPHSIYYSVWVMHRREEYWGPDGTYPS